MNFLPRLLGLGLLSLLLGLLLASCETTKRGADEYALPSKVPGLSTSTPTTKTAESRQIAQVTDSSVVFKTPQSELATAFIRQFGDGTVVDKVLVRKAPVGPKETGGYFLVGMGQRNGNFRAMALPLSIGGDNSYNLSPLAERYVITAVGCPACFFNFEGGRIVGTTCSENSGGNRCDLKMIPNNTLFASK